MLMDTNVTNSVRQILMNELGMTRESVREEMKVLVDEAVKKQVNRLIDEGVLLEMVQSHIKSRFGYTFANEVSLALSTVIKNLQEVAIEKIKNSIQITVKEADNG